jgi:general secretion pathway protein L
MLAEFADWWLTQMRSLLPASILPAATLPDARIIAIEHLPAVGGSLPAGSILLRRNGRETAIASLDLDQPPLVAPLPGTARLATGLRLPRDSILRREVVLPLAAARNVEAVIGFELDRFTPFSADEIFWSIGPVKPDRVHGRLSMQLCFVLRTQVEALLQALRRSGLNPSFVETEGGPAGAGRIDLASEHRPARRWAQTWLAALCGVLGVACLASPFLRQQIALDTVSQEIAAVAPAAQTAQRLRRQIEIAASGQAAIAAARRNGDALQVLASLTDALPDGTALNDLLLKSGDLTFDGRSTNAAALIGRLSALPGLKNPSFTAPVTRTADGNADEFSMHATVQQ